MTNIPKQCPSCGGNCGRKNGVCQYGGIKTKPKIKPLKWFTTDKPLADGWFLFKLKVNPKLKWVAVVNDEWVDIDGFKYKNNYEYLSQYRIAGPIPEPEE